MKDTFNIRKFLTENKLTQNSRYINEELDYDIDDEDAVHELLGDLFAPGNARMDIDLDSVEGIASTLKEFGTFYPNAVKDALSTLQGDLDKDDFIKPSHIPKLKQAFAIVLKGQKDIKKSKSNLPEPKSDQLSSEVSKVFSAFGGYGSETILKKVLLTHDEKKIKTTLMKAIKYVRNNAGSPNVFADISSDKGRVVFYVGNDSFTIDILK